MVNIIKWHKDQGGHGGRLSGHALRLLRETVELCIASGATYKEINEATYAECIKATNRHEWGGNPDDLPQEFADVSILQEVFAHYAGIDVERAREDKFKIILDRKWSADADGVLWRP